VPWTKYGSTSSGTGYNNIVRSITTDGTVAYNLQPATNATWYYSYSIIGNTMYVNYQYLNNTASATGSNNGNGLYVYSIPSPYTIDINTLNYSACVGANNTNYGSQVGSCAAINYGSVSLFGNVQITTVGGEFCLYIIDYTNNAGRILGSSYFATGTANMNLTFQASFPIMST
jgi:hypothetical protein